MKFVIAVLGFLFSHFVVAAGEPHITHVSAVAPDIIALTIHTGEVEHGQQKPYAPQPGDRIEKREGPHRWLKRWGEYIGSVVGPDNKTMFTFDRYRGRALNLRRIESTGTYFISSAEDPNYQKPLKPIRVSRKSKPTDMAQVGLWDFRWPVEHTIYVQLPEPLKSGADYKIQFSAKLFADHVYQHRPMRTRSEAVHVSHLGFRPDDSIKVAYLSLWKGNGGGQEYRSSKFHVIDDTSNQAVFEGKVQLSRAFHQHEDKYGFNYNKTDVYIMNFSNLATLGDYRVCVDNIGCSYPFAIAEDSWEKAFVTSARGLYHQRSGIAIGAPHSRYQRPRNMHPDDGVLVYESEVPLIDTGNGLNARGQDKGNFYLLNQHRTKRTLENAWGGYADAGDWDRRIQHLLASRYFIELLEMFPHYFAEVSLNIPESQNTLPDILDEALWGLDFFRRLQTPEGGIRGGIESEEHTRFGEGSWQESQKLMVYEPGIWSSYIYAGVAARAAHWLQQYDTKAAEEYRRSALDAMQWAEKKYLNHGYAKLPHQLIDARNLAAVEMYRLTGDETWHRLFLRTTVFKESWRRLAEWSSHDQADAAFVYLQLEDTDKQVHENTMKAMERTAEDIVKQGKQSGFRWTKPSPGAWIGWGGVECAAGG